MGDVSLNDILFYLGGIGNISYRSSGLFLEIVFQLIVLSLGIAISFNPLLLFTFLKDCIFGEGRLVTQL